MIKRRLIAAICLLIASTVYAQVENVQVAHPVYIFLQRAESIGLLEHLSLSSLPLQKMEIQEFLRLINNKREYLSNSDVKLLEKYLIEFEIVSREKTVLFSSPSDSSFVLSKDLFSGKEKFFYYYSYDSTRVLVSPLGMLDNMFSLRNGEKSIIGTLGVRFNGSIDNRMGFNLQATNGRLFSGSRELAAADKYYAKSIKFTKLNDDIDFSESHVNYRNRWFFASIARETKLEGAGLQQRIFIADLAPAFDALTLAAKFSNFEYSFIHGSLIGEPTQSSIGAFAEIPPKYMAYHKIAVRPSWGEVAFVEQVIYSNRNTDLAYLNPIGFLKSIEHALHDRDNSLMGLFYTVRPVSRLQIKGSYLLDDIIFEKVGTGYWSNKMAYNFSVEYASLYNLDIGFEYARVEPYTFSHFNRQNTVSHDGKLIGSILLPNSDRYLLSVKYWWGQRYPIELGISYTRHGANVFEGDSLIYNAGGDPFQTRRWFDPMEISFLSGKVERNFSASISMGYEILSNFYVLGYFRHSNINGDVRPYARLILKFGDF